MWRCCCSAAVDVVFAFLCIVGVSALATCSTAQLAQILQHVSCLMAGVVGGLDTACGVSAHQFIVEVGPAHHTCAATTAPGSNVGFWVVCVSLVWGVSNTYMLSFWAYLALLCWGNCHPTSLCAAPTGRGGAVSCLPEAHTSADRPLQSAVNHALWRDATVGIHCSQCGPKLRMHGVGFPGVWPHHVAPWLAEGLACGAASAALCWP